MGCSIVSRLGSLAYRDSCVTKGSSLAGPDRPSCSVTLGRTASQETCGGVRRNLDLEFSRSKAIQSAHAGGVLWLDLDHVDHRYLIAGGADGSIAAYDVQVRA